MACAANLDYKIPEKLRLGVIELPPFVMHNPTGEWAGIGCDFVHAVAKELGAGLEFVPFDRIEQLEDVFNQGTLHPVPVAIVAEGRFSHRSPRQRQREHGNQLCQSHAGAVFSQGCWGCGSWPG